MKICKVPHQPEWGGHVSTASYALGFVFSFFLTAIAFFLVKEKFLLGYPLGCALFVLALLQVWVQMIFYFNFGKEAKPKWGFLAFYFMLILLLIIVIGTLIIMTNLDYRMMPNA